MGYMRHHAILVTGIGGVPSQRIETAHRKAVEIFRDKCLVSELSPETTNGYRTFAVFPDGSKEGWGESDAGNGRRARFTEWLREAGSVDWVEVQFGDEEGDQCIVDASGLAAEEQP